MRRLTLFLLLLATSALSLERQPNADYHARREKLAAAVKNGVVLLFASTESAGPNQVYGFHQDNDFYYLTGWREPGAALLVAPANDHHGYTEIFFLPNHNLTQEKWTGPKLGPENPDAPSITGFDQVMAIDKMRDAISSLMAGKPAPVYIETPEGGENSPTASAMDWLERSNAFPGFLNTQDVKPYIANLRMAKDAGELGLLQKAIDASIEAHIAAMKAMKPGLNEHDISALMEGEYLKHGCERPAYAPIVGSGYYSTVLHYSADDNPIHDGDVVVLDVAGEYSMYASDITRTLPANGKFSARQREIYDIVLGAQQAAEKAFVFGKSTLTGNDENSLYKAANDYIKSHGKDLHGEPLDKYFIHGLGHFVGLHVHDAGDYKVPLVAGAVFTLEPGIYIPEEKLGVRIEDMYTITSEGKLVKMSVHLPSRPEEVEAMMAGSAAKPDASMKASKPKKNKKM